MKAIIIHKSNFNNHPPLISAKTALNNLGYKVDILTKEKNDQLHMNVDENYYAINKEINIPLIGNLIWYAKFAKAIIELQRKNYDLYWIEGGDTLSLFGVFLKKMNCHIIQLSELYDIIPHYRRAIGLFINKFNAVVVPEINRAFIIKVWYRLNNLPLILPNKPNYKETNKPTRENILESENIVNDIIRFAQNRKIILYQGIIANDRKFTGVADFVNSSDQYCLVLIGKDIGYKDELITKYNNIKYFGFLTPPLHLNVTKLAHICLLAYDSSSLNKVFCAPNKIWEYSQQSKPMLCQNLPGIINIFNENKIGKNCDLMNANDVKNAINDIEKHYSNYAENSKNFYNTFNFDKRVEQIINEAKIIK